MKVKTKDEAVLMCVFDAVRDLHAVRGCAPDAGFSVDPEAAYEVGQGSHTETKKLQGGTKEINISLIRFFSIFRKN